MVEVDADFMSDEFFQSLPPQLEATFVKYICKTGQGNDMVIVNIIHDNHFMRGKCYGNDGEKWLKCIPKGAKILVGRVRPNKAHGFEDEIECRSYSFIRQPLETQMTVQAFYASQNQHDDAPAPSDGPTREQLSMFGQASETGPLSLPEPAVLSPARAAAVAAAAPAPAAAPIELPVRFRGPRSKISITLSDGQVDGLLSTSLPGESIQEVMRRAIDAWIQLSWKRA
jgi:hypothetical protein